jgi:hypothetical protein
MGKWSKIARAKHSARMKERFAVKNTSNPANLLTTNKLSVKERINIIEHHLGSIKQQLGG